jgi:L-asparaginase
VVEPIQKLIKKGIPVVMVSRCYNGLAEPIYDYVGGGIDLERMGVIFCQGLNGQKARIKLQVGLSNHMNGKEIARYMHDAVS